MSEENMSWFHCGRCGSLFQAPGGDRPDRSCGVCGRNPSLGFARGAAAPAAAAVAAAPLAARSTVDLPRRVTKEVDPAISHGHEKRQRNILVKLVFGWLLFLTLLVLVTKWLWFEEALVGDQIRSGGDGATQELSAADSAFLSRELPKCQEVFGGFLGTHSPEGWSQFVLGGATMAPKMQQYVETHPIIRVDAGTLTSEGSGVIELPEGKAIETRWRTADGRRLEAVFRKERGQWRLDWEHYVRFSDFPWGIFLAGGGEPVGEFRLLARRRLADEKTEGDRMISLVLYAPRFGYPAQAGAQSPEFVFDPESEPGRLLLAAFNSEAEGRAVFGSGLPSADPEGMIRLRIRVRRSEEGEGRQYEIAEVLACHWLSLDDPGVTPVAERTKNPRLLD